MIKPALRLLLLLLTAAVGRLAVADCPALQSAFAQAVAAGNAKASAAAGESLFARCPIADADWQDLSLQYAAALGRSGRTADALAVVSRCISRQPSAGRCAVEKAALLGRLGRPAEAQQALETARALGASATVAAIPPPPGRQTPSSMPAPASPPVSPGASGGKAGSGFFINDAGVIVTNAHVVAGCHQLATRAGEPLSVIVADPVVDLALLQSARPAPASAAFRAAPPPRLGEDVLAFGYPLPGLLSSEGNVTAGILSASRGLGDDPHQLQITAPVQSGNSGGPLVDASGNVIGVVVAKLNANRVAAQTGDLPQNVNFAVKAEEVTRLLASRGIPYRQAALGDHLGAADLAEATRRFTVQILCSP